MRSLLATSTTSAVSRSPSLAGAMKAVRDAYRADNEKRLAPVIKASGAKVE